LDSTKEDPIKESSRKVENLEEEKKQPASAPEPDQNDGQCPVRGTEGPAPVPVPEHDVPELPEFEDSAQTDDESAEASLINID